MEISIESQINEIELAEPQKVNTKTEKGAFELKAEEWILNDLSGNYGARLVRAMLHNLNVDESYVLKWRLENKFKQYQILNYYAPNCMPATLPLSDILSNKKGIYKAKKLFKKGYFLKKTLGDASYTTQTWDKTSEFAKIAVLPSVCTGGYEDYMLQRKIDIRTEFRVHTFSKEIIPCLSYVAHGVKKDDYHQDLENFLCSILDKLPDSILSGTLIAWDIALTNEGHYYVIEANFTGFHPEYRKGFQTTGYVDDHRYGSIICAWLNIYFRKTFGVYVASVTEALKAQFPFYQSFEYYLSIFKVEHLNLVVDKSKAVRPTLIIYLGEDSNILLINLIRHFLFVDFAGKYIVIVKDEYISKMHDLFSRESRIQFCTESWIVPKEQYEAIGLVDQEKRKEICCHHATRLAEHCSIL